MGVVEPRVWGRVPRIWVMGALIIGMSPMVGGCVVMEEKYNAEKARSLNFQRLLAQEEKRSLELESEVKRTKIELADFESRNRELAAHVQTVREQMTRLQEETEAIREAAVLERKAMEDMRKSGAAVAKPKKPAESFEALDEIVAKSSSPPKVHDAEGGMESASAAKSGPTLHVVKPGETLFRISRRYGIEVEKLMKMNKLPDDIIEVGQKLIVGME
ncbi:MAG TPA: LysM peptidoglycan-binding domain-containing protein [Nitrospira sp.]|nr:LysM peptidoglycan-binding domain-containing protein [Nitrospira sp.]